MSILNKIFYVIPKPRYWSCKGLIQFPIQPCISPAHLLKGSQKCAQNKWKKCERIPQQSFSVLKIIRERFLESKIFRALQELCTYQKTCETVTQTGKDRQFCHSRDCEIHFCNRDTCINESNEGNKLIFSISFPIYCQPQPQLHTQGLEWLISVEIPISEQQENSAASSGCLRPDFGGH